MDKSGKSDGTEPNRSLDRAGVPGATAEDCITAINTPVRRRILRLLHEVNEARSPAEVSRAFRLPVSYVSYHVKVLKECGTVVLTDTRPKRGSIEHFYASTIGDYSLVVELLEETRSDDEKSCSLTAPT
jgi:DNA-binding transcriptional ArsR family regulator